MIAVVASCPNQKWELRPTVPATFKIKYSEHSRSGATLADTTASKTDVLGASGAACPLEPDRGDRVSVATTFRGSGRGVG